MNVRSLRGLGAAALIAAASCNSLDVQNPNEPDLKRALADPASIEAVGAGAMRTWFNAYTSLRGAGVLVTQANSFSSSWNNGNLNFYSSIDNPGATPDLWTRTTTPRAWQNDPAAAARTSIDVFWGGGVNENKLPRGGFYNALSSANDALMSIRKSGVVIRNASDTKRAETIGVWMQGAALMMLALQYDKAYIVDENSPRDVSGGLIGLAYSNRAVMRDTAVSKLQQAAALATANGFTTPPAWTNGRSYTSAQIAQIANTMAAMTLAYWPRDNSELAKVDWAKVASFASNGMSSGVPVDLTFVQDGDAAWLSEVMGWFESIDTGRLHTRVAHLLDPATQQDPWPAAGNPQPNSVDKRLGDGTFGDTSTKSQFNTVPLTAKGGTDYAWSGANIFRPSRGQYHQSNIAQVRYDLSGVQDPSGQYGGFGPAPAIMATLNDLLWAEALLRQGPANAAQAITLINKTRVGRGGLQTAAVNAGIGSDADGPCMSNGLQAKDGNPCSLWAMLLYEKEVERPGQGAAPFWEQRRLKVTIGGGWAGDNSPKRVIQGLLPGTPREMPVTYKELGVKGEALYTWGGSTPNSPTPP
jgi:hypothetical protein